MRALRSPVRAAASLCLLVLVACGTGTHAPPSTGSTGGSGPSATTGPSLPTTKASFPATGPIGLIGCSNSGAAVTGYIRDGGHRFWPGAGYGGGTVVVWADDLRAAQSRYWPLFRSKLAQAPGTRVIWWELCTYPFENDAENYQAALTILAEVHRLVPGAVVLVSALNGFVPPHACPYAGPDGPARMQALADRLVSEGRAEAGPRLGQLRSVYETPSAGATAANNQTESDGCHPNQAGAEVLGRTLLAFFGK
jgi:hypothetical protein